MGVELATGMVLEVNTWARTSSSLDLGGLPIHGARLPTSRPRYRFLDDIADMRDVDRPRERLKRNATAMPIPNISPHPTLLLPADAGP